MDAVSADEGIRRLGTPKNLRRKHCQRPISVVVALGCLCQLKFGFKKAYEVWVINLTRDEHNHTMDPGPFHIFVPEPSFPEDYEEVD